MRAGVLSDPEIVGLLNEKFINVWCLNSDLKQLREKHGMESLPPLLQAVIKGWKPNSPVDSLVISPKMELLGRQSANDLFFELGNEMVKGYTQFLNHSLVGKRPGLGPKNESLRHHLMIEMMGPEEFKINGKGPFKAQEARKEAVRVSRGKQSIFVWLQRNSDAVSDEQYKEFNDSLHKDGGMLEGLDIKAVGGFNQ